MADAPETTRSKHALRAKTSNSGFSVRKSEETISVLRKENFNLKLKIFLLESKKSGAASIPFANSGDEKEFMDLFLENEGMRNELHEKQLLLKSAYDAIECLEYQKFNQEQEFQKMMIDQQIQTFEMLKLKPKKVRRKKSHLKFSPTVEKSCDKCFTSNFDMITLRADNAELITRVKELEAEAGLRIQEVKNLTEMKSKLQENMEVNERKLDETENKIAKFSETTKQQKSITSESLQQENELLKKAANEWSSKIVKLERDGQDLERIVNEQSALMKALNRSIEAKNEQLIAFKNRIDLTQVSSSSSDVYYPEDFSLAGVSKSSSESSQYPFYNPLFGKEYESMYR